MKTLFIRRSEVSKCGTLTEETIQGNNSRRHVYEDFGRLIDFADLIGPVKIKVESDDYKLEVVSQEFEVDRDIGLLGHCGRESNSNEDHNDRNGKKESQQ